MDGQYLAREYINMTKEELSALNVSFYRNLKSADAKIVTIGQVLDAIRSTFYEPQVTTIRRLKAEGKKAEADEVKSNLHAVTFCATFNGRRLSRQRFDLHAVDLNMFFG